MSYEGVPDIQRLPERVVKNMPSHTRALLEEKRLVQEDLAFLITTIEKEPLKKDGTRGYWRDDLRVLKILSLNRALYGRSAVKKTYNIITALGFSNKDGNALLLQSFRIGTHRLKRELQEKPLAQRQKIEKEITELVEQIKAEPLHADGTRGYWKDDARVRDILNAEKRREKRGALKRTHKTLCELGFRGKNKKNINYVAFSQRVCLEEETYKNEVESFITPSLETPSDTDKRNALEVVVEKPHSYWDKPNQGPWSNSAEARAIIARAQKGGSGWTQRAANALNKAGFSSNHGGGNVSSQELFDFYFKRKN